VGGSSSAGTGGAPVGDLCEAYPSTLDVDLPWGNGQTVTTGALGGFAYDAVLVGKISVPPDAVPGSNVGSINVAEYQGPPTYRTASMSLYPCDFRGIDDGNATDPTGADHPLAWATGNTATANFVVGPSDGSYIGLVPGQTYYFNVRNYSQDIGGNSCSSMTTCDAIVAINPPTN